MKKLVTSILIFAMMLSLVACGEDDKESAKATSPNGNVETSEKLSPTTSNTSQSEIETSKGQHAVVIKAEAKVVGDVVHYDSQNVEVEPGLDYKDYTIENPTGSSTVALDLNAFFGAMGIDSDSISLQVGGSCIVLGDTEKDEVAVTITKQQLWYYVDGEEKYLYFWDMGGMAVDGVALCVRDEYGDPQHIFRMHESDVQKALEVVGRAFANKKTSSPFELGET